MNNNNPLVSIIVPVYNVEKYLRKCVDSLINQTYHNVEILLVDDGSKDGSGKICDEYTLKDNRVKVVHKENGGVSSARNTGLDNATGDYIMWADPDDYCDDSFVEELLNSISRNSSDLALCSFYLEFANREIAFNSPFETGVYSIEDVFNALFFDSKNSKTENMFTSLWSGIFKKSIIEDSGICFDNNVSFCEDFLFYAEYISHCKKISVVNIPLYHYVQRSQSIVHSSYMVDKSKVSAIIYVFKRFFAIVHTSNVVEESMYIMQLRRKYVMTCLGYVLTIDKARSISDANDFLGFLLTKTKLVSAIRELDLGLLSMSYRLTASIVATKCRPLIISWVVVAKSIKKALRFIKRSTKLIE